MKHTNIFTHLAAAAIVTILTGLLYASVQQVHRSGANDPQLQVAMDISYKLKNGDVIGESLNDDTVEISQSLALFHTLYNDKVEPLASTGLLNGKPPSLPQAVFGFARKNNENVFTWQPQRGIRVAVVLKFVNSPSYSLVAVGRSLYEVEVREENLRW